MPIDALSVLCVQLTRDLLAIAKFLLLVISVTHAAADDDDDDDDDDAVNLPARNRPRKRGMSKSRSDLILHLFMTYV